MSLTRLHYLGLYKRRHAFEVRTVSADDLQQFLARFGQSRLDALLTNAAPHLSAGRLILAADHLHLAEHALMTSDDIMSDLMA